MEKLKVLISAYSCQPGMGSEPGVGWNIAKAISKYHEVWVLTRPDEGKEEIEAELAENLNPNLNFVYFNLPILGSMWKWKFGGMQFHYYLWQIQVYFVACRLHKQVQFDIAHHVTFVKHSRPCFLSFLPIPLLWGPVGGGEFAPRAFWQNFSFSSKIHESVRLLACWIFEKDPFVRFTVRRSAHIRATTQDTASRLGQMGARQVEIYSESGLSNEEITYLSQFPVSAHDPIRFISSGRLLYWKGFHLGLRAFSQANLPDAEYWIFGSGPEQERLQRLAEDLGISQQVKFWQRLPRQELLQKLSQGTALVHPSLHDSGGWVCLEAMAAGLPVLCLNLGGPAVQVTDETGFKVAPLSPEQAVKDLADAMRQLALNPELRVQMGEAGRKRVCETFSWEVKAQNLTGLYQKILAKPALHLEPAVLPK